MVIPHRAGHHQVTVRFIILLLPVANPGQKGLRPSVAEGLALRIDIVDVHWRIGHEHTRRHEAVPVDTHVATTAVPPGCDTSACHSALVPKVREEEATVTNQFPGTMPHAQPLLRSEHQVECERPADGHVLEHPAVESSMLLVAEVQERIRQDLVAVLTCRSQRDAVQDSGVAEPVHGGDDLVKHPGSSAPVGLLAPALQGQRRRQVADTGQPRDHFVVDEGAVRVHHEVAVRVLLGHVQDALALGAIGEGFAAADGKKVGTPLRLGFGHHPVEHVPIQFGGRSSGIRIAAGAVQVAALARAHEQQPRRIRPIAGLEGLPRGAVPLFDEHLLGHGLKDGPHSSLRKTLFGQSAVQAVHHGQAQESTILIHSRCSLGLAARAS